MASKQKPVFSFVLFFSSTCSRFNSSDSVGEEGRKKNINRRLNQKPDTRTDSRRDHVHHCSLTACTVAVQKLLSGCSLSLQTVMRSRNCQQLGSRRCHLPPPHPPKSAAREAKARRGGQNVSGGALPACCLPSLSAAGASRTTLTPSVKLYVNYSLLREVPRRWRGTMDVVAVHSGLKSNSGTPEESVRWDVI